MVAAVEPRVRRPVLGYAMVFAAATLFGINGSVAKVALGSGLSSLRLTEARCAGACIGLVLIVLIRSIRVPCGSIAAACSGSPSSASSGSRSCSSSTFSRFTGSRSGLRS